MQLTSRRRISYPSPSRTDRPDVPAHLQILALALDLDVIFNMGVDSDRLAAAHQVGGGRMWWATDTHIMWWDDGTTWQQMGGAPLNSPVFTGTPQAPTPPAGDVSTKIATTAFVASFFPAGAIIPYAGGAAPVGWLIANGQAVDRVTYAALFAAVGTTYGTGDGSTTFNVPDLRGRVPVGLNSGTFTPLGHTGGEETHVTTSAEMPSHTHAATAVSAGTPAGTITVAGSGALTTGADSPDHTHSGTTALETTDHTHLYAATGGYITTQVQAFTSGVGEGIYHGTSETSVSTGGRSAAHVHAFTTGGRSVNHFHTVPDHTHTASFAGTAMGTHTHTIANTGGGAAHNNLQPYITLNYLVKF